MKKIISLLLVGIMVVSMIPTAFATTNYTNGTQVEYDAAADDTIGDSNNDGSPDNVEYYTVTVPALLAPGGSGNVVAQGTWASNRKLNVTADETVTLTNTISGADEKVLDVTFPGISLVGSNTAAVSDTKQVSVADIEAALFGIWSGVFEYNVEMVDDKEMVSFTVYDYVYTDWLTLEPGEEGYDPENPNKYVEKIVDKNWVGEYQAEEGMTWKQWIDTSASDKFVYTEWEIYLITEGDSPCGPLQIMAWSEASEANAPTAVAPNDTITNGQEYYSFYIGA